MKTKVMYILLLSCVLFIFCLVMISSFSNIAVQTSSEVNPSQTTIIIDAGHGGEDGGAEVDGVLEKDINLCISDKLADILRLSGYRVSEIRDEDISVYDDGADTLREKKVSDLNHRVDTFNSSEQNIVVSIHQNKFDSARYSGTQIFYSVNHPDSTKLAESVRKAVVSLLQPDNERELKPGSSDIFILDHADVPAIIVECGFLSNDEERAKLLDDTYQSEMAFSIAMGVLEYCKLYR